ncbi:MAG: shikimate kinase [Spirochaetales bacterium]|nr:shikimate kinase [Spirochaetales bacterium]
MSPPFRPIPNSFYDSDMPFIIIGGLKHSGKSTLGKILAEDWDLPFFDLDDLMLSEMDYQWKTVRELYKVLGKEVFQRVEMDAARTFHDWHMPSQKHRGAVLSLGGGTIENEDAMVWLRHSGTRVYIRANEDLLYQRIMAKGRPPFLSEENPQEDFAQLYQKRHALYSDFAQVVQDVDDASPKINAQRLLVTLEKFYARK